MEIDRRMLLAGAAAGVAAAATGLPNEAAANAAVVPKAPAAATVYKVGDVVVASVHEGTAARPYPPGFIRNLSDAETVAAYAAVGLPSDQLVNTFTPILVATASKLVLFDTGMADNAGPTTGKLAANLAAIGVKPGDIDVVVLSHFHGDHVNGLRNKAGEWLYSKAEVMVPAKEWEFWMDDARMSAAPDGMKGAFQGVRKAFGDKAKDVARFEWGKEILPGVTAVQADGHTPGHTAFLIASGKDQMMYVGDITNNPAVFARNPELKVMFDMDAEKAVATRKALLDRAAADKIRVAFYHGAFPSNGYVLKNGTGYEMVPAFWG